MMKIGVLAAQGAFAEHIAVLHKLKIDAVPVRLPRELAGLDGLIIPGGESTTISKLMTDYKLREVIKERAAQGMVIFGTCAGMILLAKHGINGYPETLKLMDITVARNAFGRQKESFETDLKIPVLGEKPFHAVFIRAPLIKTVGEKVEVLAKLADGTIIAAREGKLLGASFHPELTDDARFHEYFLNIVAGKH
ncbi:MAG: pyridoxal 5'-phosphate synthase glutaminase subunit PdxT [Dehalococcoidales bacterium]|nr:pyridoxal 5'-phosphate synthase glutaminase subunit PdxT [Dehalococcoidales bacterium]